MILAVIFLLYDGLNWIERELSFRELLASWHRWLVRLRFTTIGAGVFERGHVEFAFGKDLVTLRAAIVKHGLLERLFLE